MRIATASGWWSLAPAYRPVLVPSVGGASAGRAARGAGTPLMDTLCSAYQSTPALLLLGQLRASARRLCAAGATPSCAAPRSRRFSPPVASRCTSRLSRPTRCKHFHFPSPSANVEIDGALRSGAALRRARPAAATRLRIDSGARSRGRRAVHPSRRHSAGAGVGGRSCPFAFDRADQCPSARPLQAAHRRNAHGAASPADAARDARLELRSSCGAGARGVAAAGDLRRRLHARSRFGGRVRRGDRRIRSDRPALATGRALAGRRRYERCRCALPTARDHPRLCAGEARRSGRNRRHPSVATRSTFTTGSSAHTTTGCACPMRTGAPSTCRSATTFALRSTGRSVPRATPRSALRSRAPPERCGRNRRSSARVGSGTTPPSHG